MHDHSSWRHEHDFDAGNVAGERRTWIVVAIAAATMVAEIVGGWLTGSMALLADGWHMATHVVALSISGLAYRLARRWAEDERFTFGTWKVEVLGAYSSALLLGVVALAMAVESAARLYEPEPIHFVPALGVAVVGLAVNLASALILWGGVAPHPHADYNGAQSHGHAHSQPHSHDLNLRSAYAHVLADAFTSLLAIGALAAGLWGGWTRVDPAVGFVGAGVIAWWARSLLADSARVLLDREMDDPVVRRIREAIEAGGDVEVSDLHVWRVGRSSHAAVISVVAHDPLPPETYRGRLQAIASLVHVSVEVNRCPRGCE